MVYKILRVNLMPKQKKKWVHIYRQEAEERERERESQRESQETRHCKYDLMTMMMMMI